MNTILDTILNVPVRVNRGDTVPSTLKEGELFVITSGVNAGYLYAGDTTQTVKGIKSEYSNSSGSIVDTTSPSNLNIAVGNTTQIINGFNLDNDGTLLHSLALSLISPYLNNTKQLNINAALYGTSDPSPDKGAVGDVYFKVSK